MARKLIDCREFPSEGGCTIAISADTDEELLEAAVLHACAVHGHQDTPELRNNLRQMFKTDQSASPAWPGFGGTHPFLSVGRFFGE